MPVELIAKIEPKNSGAFPMVEDIHLEGGLQIRDDIADRNSIPTLNRKEGMLCYVVSVTTTYRLVGGITNSDWVIEGAATSTLLSLTAAEGVVEGDLLIINADGEVEKANSNTGTTNDARVIGASAGIYAATATAQVRSIFGTLVPVRFAAAPAGTANGSPVYLSTVDGEATLTPPTASGSIIFLLGILQGGNGITTIPNIIFQPVLVARN